MASAPFECPFCLKRFRSEDFLNDHIRQHKGMEYKCRACRKGYPTQNALNGHMRVHKEKKRASSPAVPLQNTFLEPDSSSARTLPPNERPRTSNLDLNKPPTEEDKNNDDNNAGAGVKIQKNDSARARGSEIDLNEAPEAGPVKHPKKQFDLNELPPKDDEETDDNAGAGFGA